jgi:hypothetical protein
VQYGALRDFRSLVEAQAAFIRRSLKATDNLPMIILTAVMRFEAGPQRVLRPRAVKMMGCVARCLPT